MKTIKTLINTGLLLCCLFAIKVPANIIPPVDYQYHYDPATGNWSQIVDKLFPAPGRPPVWQPGSTDMPLYIPNVARPNWIKNLYLELDFAPGTANTLPPPQIGAFGPAGTYAIKLINTIVGASDVTYHWEIYPQPEREIIYFAAPPAAFGVVGMDVATLCVPVPEPSTYLAGLSALGMLGLFGWRNRK